MSGERILLIQESTPDGERRRKLLQGNGFAVIAVDSQDLYWPKYIEHGGWGAIVFDSSSFPMIFVELASELGSAVRSRGSPVILLTAELVPTDSLPGSLRRARQATDDSELIRLLGELSV